MSAGTEIVFVHNASSWHLPFVLHQAAAANPETRISLLSEVPRQRAFYACRLSDLESRRSQECVRTYRHRSVNSASFELFCYLRWFYLLEYLIQKNLEAALYVDSDVLVFSSVQEMMANRPGLRGRCAFLVPAEVPNPAQWPASAHTSYWTREWLGRFCEFALSSFVDPDCVRIYEERWQQVIASGTAGGVSDMTTLYLFWQRHPEAVVNLAEKAGQAVFDWNFSTGLNHRLNEYETDSGAKKVVWRERRPMFVESAPSGARVRAHTIHFQGRAKRFIPRFYSGPPFAFQTWARARRWAEGLMRHTQQTLGRIVGS